MVGVDDGIFLSFPLSLSLGSCPTDYISDNFSNLRSHLNCHQERNELFLSSMELEMDRKKNLERK